MEQHIFVKTLMEELNRAASIAIDQFVGQLTPGLALQPFWLVLPILTYAFLDSVETFGVQVRRIPIRLAVTLLSKAAEKETSTKVIRLDKAKDFAIGTALATIFDVTGNVPPPGLRSALRLSKMKGIKKAIEKLLQKAVLGPSLFHLFQFLRAPAGYILKFVFVLWNLALDVASIGMIIVLYDLINADWEKESLSQSHPRKRLYDEVINKRL